MNFIIIFFGWLFSLCLHEFSHALVAYHGGDTTVKEKGYLTFNPLQQVSDGEPSLTTGFGDMVRADGEWTFSMQMASGSSSQVTHWAYMLQCSPDEPCWTDLPGPGGSLESFLATCGAS